MSLKDTVHLIPNFPHEFNLLWSRAAKATVPPEGAQPRLGTSVNTANAELILFLCFLIFLINSHVK